MIVWSDNQRYFYYYSHLNIMEEGEYHADIRAKIQAALNNPFPEQVAAGTAIAEGELISGVGDFNPTPWAHLHFSIFDACDNYDSLDPLEYLELPYEDAKSPIIEQFDFVDGNAPIVLADDCDQLNNDNVDVIAKMRDVWDDSEEWLGNEHLGVHEARLTARLLHDGQGWLEQPSVELERTWYQHDQLPFLCRGPDKGVACLTGPDPVTENTTPFTFDDFQEHMGTIVPTVIVGAFMSEHFATQPSLFHNTTPYLSDSRDYADQSVAYFHRMTTEWALYDESGLGGSIDTTNGGDLPKGWYQFTVEAFDREGNSAVAHRWARIRQGSDGGAPFNQAPGDLLIRDHQNDIGGIPSTAGGDKHYRSPDIRVKEVGDPPNPDPDNEEFWKTQAIHVTQGEPYTLWVRVQNRGCDTIDQPIYVSAVSAKPAMISSDWAFADSQNHHQVVSGLDPGEAAVVEFVWTPASSGHLCLLAVTHAADDPSSVPFDNGFDFDNFNHPTASSVPIDNNLAQRNVTISDEPFELGNPFDVAIDLGAHFDCNDFPIYMENASAVLEIEYNEVLWNAWREVPGTTMQDVGTHLLLSFERCRVELPAANLPAATLLDAKLDLTLPGSVSGVFDVDLTGLVNGAAHSGMSVRVEGGT